MKYFLITLFTIASFANALDRDQRKEMQVTPASSLNQTKGSIANFDGDVIVTRYFAGGNTSKLQAASVRFAPGAHSAWHTHPAGQLLIVTDGEGVIQEWGKPIRRIKKGDVVWTPPGVKHWHGADSKTAMTHTAIQESVDGKTVEWLEKVSYQEYTKASK